jgi:hypothetical protein
MKGIDSTGAPLVHVPGWMGGWMIGWMDGSKSRFKDCLQQSKTTTSPYHPKTNAQVEVCNKTIATYLKTQVDASILDWELYMASMAFAYNTSFHQNNKNIPVYINIWNGAQNY